MQIGAFIVTCRKVTYCFILTALTIQLTCTSLFKGRTAVRTTCLSVPANFPGDSKAGLAGVLLGVDCARGLEVTVGCVGGFSGAGSSQPNPTSIGSGSGLLWLSRSCLGLSRPPPTETLMYQISWEQMSRIMRKTDNCLCENKAADQLCSNCEADQRLCFRYIDSTIPPLLIPKFKASSLFL